MIAVKEHPKYGYLVSSDGRVFIPETRFSKGHWTYGSLSGCGYMIVSVNTGHGRKNMLVHRLVAETFIDNPDGKLQVDHINRDKTDNSVENLRWATRSENQRNTDKSDRSYAKYGIHVYEDRVEYNKANCKRWYYEHRDAINLARRSKEFRDKENARRHEKRREELAKMEAKYD